MKKSALITAAAVVAAGLGTYLVRKKKSSPKKQVTEPAAKATRKPAKKATASPRKAAPAKSAKPRATKGKAKK